MIGYIILTAMNFLISFHDLPMIWSGIPIELAGLPGILYPSKDKWAIGPSKDKWALGHIDGQKISTWLYIKLFKTENISGYISLPEIL